MSLSDAAASNGSAETLDAVVAIARRAGDAVMAVYAKAFDVRHKGDRSPLTVADERAEAIIVPALQALAPGKPVVAEEAAARGESPVVALGQAFWLVDPLDGTREFVQRNGEFTVNIARIEGGVPVMGVVLAPALGVLWAGAVGLGAFREAAGRPRERIACRACPDAGVTVLASRAHGDTEALDRYLAPRRVAALRQAGSSLKFCLIAAGEADLYPRFGPTMEWDTAAGHAVLAAAGGRVDNLDGSPLRYGKAAWANPPFVAFGA